jgi:hypothetical protein
MIKSLFAATALAVGASSSMAATTVDVTAEFFAGGIPLPYQVSFAGTDTNSDGILTLGELTSFSAISEFGAYSFSLPEVISFGIYDIGTNTWLSELMWFADSTAVQVVYFGIIPTIETFEVAAVPEPANAAFLLAGLGLLGAVARRKASQKV